MRRATSAAAPAAPDAEGGSAFGFLFYVYPDPQPLCPLLVALNATTDPAADRGSCLLFNFSTTGAVGAVVADLYAEGEADPFVEGIVADPDTDPGTFQVSTAPDATWPAGKLRMVVRDTVGPIGEFSFFHNALLGTATAEAPKAPGAAFTVTGTISEHSKRATFGSDKGVPATFKVRLSKPDGTELFTSPLQTAAAAGTFSYAVPAGTTTPIVSGSATGYQTTLKVEIVDAAYSDTAPIPPPVTGDWANKVVATTSQVIVSPATELSLQNSFVSSVGWVKPGQTYPSRIILTNPTAAPVTPTSVKIDAPTGSTIVKAGATTVNAATYTWTPGVLTAGETKTLVLESQAATTTELDTIVWRDLSTTAVLTVPTKPDQTVSSHGPKVIPPAETFDTARYGDRPFPVIPVQYNDRAYQETHSGSSLESVINDPDVDGSTYNLFQEMSLGQLFPNGTVPSDGIASKDFTYAPGFDFTQRRAPGQHLPRRHVRRPAGRCRGYADLPRAHHQRGLQPARPDRVLRLGLLRLGGRHQPDPCRDPGHRLGLR